MKRLFKFIRSLFTIDQSMEYHRIERKDRFDKNEAKNEMKRKVKK